MSHEVELEQREVIAARRASRDQGAVDKAIARMVAAAEAGENTVPAMLDAARAEATLGEICNAFKPMWGEYREPCGAILSRGATQPGHCELV